MLARPGMWMPDGAGLQVFASVLLDDLCFIDGRSGDTRFDNAAKYGKLGVRGPFVHTFGAGRYVDEVASVFGHPVVHGRSLSGLSTAQMFLIRSSSMSKAITVTVEPLTWMTSPG
jgi:hypothetical protein